jgi:hypothetical protein
MLAYSRWRDFPQLRASWGADQTVELGYEGAKVCALNILALIKLALVSLDRVREFLFVSGYVNAITGLPRNSTVEVQVAILFE